MFQLLSRTMLYRTQRVPGSFEHYFHWLSQPLLLCFDSQPKHILYVLRIVREIIWMHIRILWPFFYCKISTYFSYTYFIIYSFGIASRFHTCLSPKHNKKSYCFPYNVVVSLPQCKTNRIQNKINLLLLPFNVAIIRHCE